MMMTRRDAVAAFALFAEFLASARHTDAQAQTAPATPPASPRPPVFKHDLPNVTLDDWEVTGHIVDYEGAVIAKISGQGEEKTYTAGQMFYEQPGATHEVSNNASQTKPARLLAMIFAKKGSTLTVPVR